MAFSEESRKLGGIFDKLVDPEGIPKEILAMSQKVVMEKVQKRYMGRKTF